MPVYNSFSKGVVFSLLLVVLVVVSLIKVPFLETRPSAYAYQTFYYAANYFVEGLSPYARYPGFDLFKYSPSFLAFPLLSLASLSLIPSAIAWQVLSTLLYFMGGYLLFKLWLPGQATMNEVCDKLNNLPSWLVVFATFLFLTDFHLNGIYLQSNTFVVAGMMLGMAFYIRKQWLLAAFVLAYVTNMKLFPVVLVLLLFVDLRWRFIAFTLLSHCVLAYLPFLLWGDELAITLYRDWLGTLIIDKELVYDARSIHFFLNLRAFLQLNFGIIFTTGYFFIMLAFAGLVGLLVIRLRFLGREQTHFSPSQLFHIFAVALLYILVFSPRTEGPTLVLLGPVYLITLWQLWGAASAYKKSMLWAFFGVFVLTSLSTSDLFRGTYLGVLSWEHDLRVIGMVLLFLLYLYWLVFPLQQLNASPVQSTQAT